MGQNSAFTHRCCSVPRQVGSLPTQPGWSRAARHPLSPKKTPPLLLTGDWRSRCPASRSSARGSCAAGWTPGIDRGSPFPARIRAGSSTRTRRERTAFLHRRGGSSCCPRFAPGALRGAPGTPLPAPAQPSPAAAARAGSGAARGAQGALPAPGCLFKFGEVGPIPSKGAWGFGVNPWQASQQSPQPRGGTGGTPGTRARAAPAR